MDSTSALPESHRQWTRGKKKMGIPTGFQLSNYLYCRMKFTNLSAGWWVKLMQLKWNLYMVPRPTPVFRLMTLHVKSVLTPILSMAVKQQEIQ
ncbi:UNVERIFIED_CONTAM: hypothetical protein K2H54_039473 [Gekko kuhli]